MNFIFWLNPDMHTIASKKDTFCDVFKQGIQPFLLFVENEL